MGINKLNSIPGAVYLYTGEIRRFNTETDQIDKEKVVTIEATNEEVINCDGVKATSLGEILQFIFLDHGAKLAIGKRISMIELIWKDEHGKHILITPKDRSVAACFKIIHEFSTSHFMEAAVVKHTLVIEKDEDYDEDDYEKIPSDHEMFLDSALRKLADGKYFALFMSDLGKFMNKNPSIAIPIYKTFKYSDYIKEKLSDPTWSDKALEECAERLIDTLPEVYHHITARKPINKKEEEE